MWISLNSAFLSIVEDVKRPDRLVVRARRREHLVTLVGATVNVVETRHRDYRFRVSLPRAHVAQLVANAVSRIDYDNFKDSVKDPDLHAMYSLWWTDHVKLDTRRKEVRAG